ncbi:MULTISPECIES: hypothetical protein [unclassified Methanoregula]|uniref:hypothetical protein n=1 Tax=unclassified Methanoregula TaxID=2649730 RepID=UPI0009CB4ED4|nr:MULTISPECIES: hypothetical protein [unclassified Methanoregula]OPX64866.1 MAG: hypothetical protein A4E33_00604 [Methanoregula sp. PtaB.Bin085]OPY32918.1 MAG: hypothetical protein A4E34_02295 [Methanoregula sp. PtaU1.Bin006]
MKSPVKPKLMRILLDGGPHREIDLATGVGFTRIVTIRKHIDSFERARFILRKRDGESGWICQLNLSRDAVLKIYGYPEFVLLRPEIREQSWFSPMFTGNYSFLPDPLPEMLRRMIVQSHTFFETISRYDTPEKLRETFGPALLLNRLAGVEDPLFNDRYLLYQIFVHAVIRDIGHGGLGSGFAQLLDESQESLKAQFEKAGSPDGS